MPITKAAMCLRDADRQIEMVAHALLRYGTLDNDQIAELVASSVSRRRHRDPTSRIASST